MYRDPIIKKYRDLIEDNQSTIKHFYYGDPIRIPQSNLPALVLSKTETRVSNFTNVEDEHGVLIQLTLVTSIKDDINAEDDEIIAGTNTLYDILEGREDDTYKLKEDSILHILRNNATLDAGNNLRTDLDTITRIDYGMTVGKRAPEAWSIEGELEFVAHFTQLR